MKTRKYGRTSITISEIGVGGHQDGVETGQGIARQARFFSGDQERARVIGRAIDRGIIYFDTTFGCELASLGRVLHLLHRREACFVSAMRVDFFSNYQHETISPGEYTRREVEERLREFGFDTVDQFMLGAVEGGDPLATPDVVEETLDELERLRQEGKVRTFGFSCHDPDYAARLLTTYPAFDAVMTPYSYANRRAEGDLEAALALTGAAWIAMKTLVWHLYGLPVTALRYLGGGAAALGLDTDTPIAQLALRFVLENPRLTTCVPAMNTVAQVDENVEASDAPPLSEEEIAQLSAYAVTMNSEKGVPLAIGGLSVDNARVRNFALELLAREVGTKLPAIDWDADEANATAREAASAVLDRLAEHAKWGALVRTRA